MTTMAIIALVAVAAIAVVLARRKPSASASRQAAQPRQRQRQRQRVPARQAAAPAAFVLAPGRSACGAAERLTDRRFPPADAPKLPLPTCDSDRCDCTLRPLEDQRKDSDETDRRLGVGLQSELYLATGNRDRRRRARGRRKTDFSR